MAVSRRRRGRDRAARREQRPADHGRREDRRGAPRAATDAWSRSCPSGQRVGHCEYYTPRGNCDPPGHACRAFCDSIQSAVNRLPRSRAGTRASPACHPSGRKYRPMSPLAPCGSGCGRGGTASAYGLPGGLHVNQFQRWSERVRAAAWAERIDRTGCHSSRRLASHCLQPHQERPSLHAAHGGRVAAGAGGVTAAAIVRPVLPRRGPSVPRWSRSNSPSRSPGGSHGSAEKSSRIRSPARQSRDPVAAGAVDDGPGRTGGGTFVAGSA